MTHQPRTTRRRVLSLTGTLLFAGLAGCTGSDGGEPDGGDAGTPSPTTSATDHHDEGTDHHDDGTNEHDDNEGTDHHDEGTDEHGHNHDEGTPVGPSSAAEVVMRTEGSEQHFAPHVVWIEPGGTVTWRLESGSHDAVAYHPDNDAPRRVPDGTDAWETELLTEEGATAEHTFETEGVYDYYCMPHEGVGMVGSVIVGEPDAHGQPALEEPQASLPEGARAELADLAETANEALGHTH